MKLVQSFSASVVPSVMKFSQKTLLRLGQCINRLQAEEAGLRTKTIKSDNAERRARTRLLIQMGSLVNLSGLSLLCGIEEGDDLQLDIENRDKAAMLLGILLDVVADFAPTDTQKERWRQAGIRQLKMAAIAKGR
jgi:hypothetical protein